MKILMINDYLYEYGGAEKVMFDLKDSLEKLGHDVKLFGSSYSKTKNVSFISRWFSISNFICSLKAINEFKPDIIHSHNVSRCISPSVLVAAKIMKIPVCMTFHDYHLVCPKTWMIFKDNKPCPHGFSKNCLTSNCITFYTGYKYFPYQWVKFVKVFLHRIIIKNTVDIAICPNMDLKVWVEKSLKINTQYIPNYYINNKVVEQNNKEYFLYVGRLSKEKGLDDLIKCFLKVDEKLVIVGDGPEKENIINLIKNLNLSNKIIYLGKVDNKKLYKYYTKAHALIIPSKWKENNPLVALESLSNKTPIIVPNIGGLPDFKINKSECYVYNNEYELIEHINFLKENNINAFLPKIYSEKIHLKKIISLYRHLI